MMPVPYTLVMIAPDSHVGSSWRVCLISPQEHIGGADAIRTHAPAFTDLAV